MKPIKKVTRRDFMVTAAAAGVCVCGLEGCFILSTAGNTPEIQPPAYELQESDKKIVIFIYKVPDLFNKIYAVKIIDSRIKDSLIIANTGNDVFKALSIKCTHNNFEVEYEHDEKRFRCISGHRAEFSTSGRVIDGPTEIPLTSYPIRRQSDKLIISLA